MRLTSLYYRKKGVLWMRRAALCLLALLFCLSAQAWAQEELHWLSPTIGGNDAVMIVDNGADWRTRLNLRAEPRKGSEIRGRIYTGTRVELYQDNGEWCTVGLRFGRGTVLTGEVMKRYLAPLEDGFSALCPLVKAQKETAIGRIGTEIACLDPGDAAYVLAVCGEEYFVMIPGVGQGYAPADAFDALTEPQEEVRIVYRAFCVPPGGLTFTDEQTGEAVFLEGGLLLEDCWQITGDEEWHVTYGAGIQRTPRVQGRIPEKMLSSNRSLPFEGEIYACGTSLIACVGETGGGRILRRTDANGDVFFALGDVPGDAVPLDRDHCVIECDAEELLSQAVIGGIVEYIRRHGALDERTHGGRVSDETLNRCTLHASLVMDPDSGTPLHMRAWLEDVDGSYVTGGELDLKTGAIVRWGCNA